MEADRWLGLDLRHLVALKTIADEGSFGRAADRLGYTQSAISQQIATLERIVGLRLIERPGGPRPISLTEAGQILLRHADAIQARLSQGDDFASVAQNYSEDPDSAPNGGDMGFVPQSNLEKASPELRKLVDSLQPGTYSPPVRTQDGYRILKVITREPAGQRLLDDPSVQQTIRETLLNRKDQLLKAAYYEVARDEAKVVNYLASSITGTSDQK